VRPAAHIVLVAAAGVAGGAVGAPDAGMQGFPAPILKPHMAACSSHKAQQWVLAVTHLRKQS
jgi:hypothetical protein